MGYLNDDYEDEDVDDFRFYFGQFHAHFEDENYDDSFNYLKGAFEIYQELNNHQKEQLSDNPFSHRYASELCSIIYNMHDERQRDVIEIITRQNIGIIICDECGRIYPDYYNHCTSCGKQFNNER